MTRAAFTASGLQSKFDWQAGGLATSEPLISYGSCQFPTLGLIVQRGWYAMTQEHCNILCIAYMLPITAALHVVLSEGCDKRQVQGLQVQMQDCCWVTPHPLLSKCLACKYREIQSHVSEPYWEIKVTYRSDDGKSCDFR